MAVPRWTAPPPPTTPTTTPPTAPAESDLTPALGTPASEKSAAPDRPVPDPAEAEAAATALLLTPMAAPGPAPTPVRPARVPAAGRPQSFAPRESRAMVAPADPRATVAPAGPRATVAPNPFDDVVATREPSARKRFDPTKLVLAVVIVAVVVGVVLAFQALTAPIGSGPAPAVPLPTISTPGQASPSAQPSPSSSAKPGAPAIASGQALDPPPAGDNNEHPEAAPLAIDGNPATVWHTRTYKSADFAGLKKGVGYAVTLTAKATVTSVKLLVNGSGGNVQVRAADPANPTQGTVLAEGPLSATTELKLSKPTDTQNIVLWFTSLPVTADGSNRLELAEVSVS
jgi:hypothetical protein